MIGTKVHEREFSPVGFALGALCAPGLSVLIVLIGAFIVSLWQGSLGPWNAVASMLGIGSMLAVVCALWGFVPALVFGALVLFPLERLRRGRPAPGWVYPLAAAGAATLYVLVSVGLAQIIGDGVVWFAPWAAPMNVDTPVRGGAIPMGAIVLAGSVGGLIYERFSRVEYRD